MRRFRSRIGTLAIAVLVMAVALAALRQSDEIWDASVFTLTVGVLLISVLLAIHRTEKRRAFWVGFALFGPVFLGLSVIPAIESRLITTKALVYVDSKVHRAVPNGVGLGYLDYDADGGLDFLVTNLSQPTTLYATKGNGTFQDVTVSAAMTWLGNQALLNTPLGLRPAGSSEHFVRIGHSLLALAAAWIGGQISCHLCARNRQSAETANR